MTGEDANWAALFDRLSRQYDGKYALVLTGADSERPRNDRLLAAWHGPQPEFMRQHSARGRICTRAG